MRKGLTSASALLAAVAALLPGTTPPAGATVVPQAARRSGRHFGPYGLVDACLGAGPSGPVVAALVVLDPVGLRAGRRGSGPQSPPQGH